MMIKRFIFNRLCEEICQPEINILLGTRQSGKTTLLKKLETYAKNAHYKTSFFDLEQPQVLAGFNRPDDQIIKKIKSAVADFLKTSFATGKNLIFKLLAMSAIPFFAPINENRKKTNQPIIKIHLGAE